ncbi:MAG: hypothetical protein JWM10_4303 [Myxococcaceae bacterium]|nr:hypothetical protein [Myxococcaceae bacterium]
MGWLDWLRAPKASDAAEGELFDEAFQRKLEYLAVAARRLFAGRMRAERRTRISGSGIEFADHRPYTPGDDLRALDWSVYGRTERLLVKRFEEEEDLTVAIVLDVSASMGFGGRARFDHARRLAAAMAYVALSNLDRVTMVAVSTKVERRLPPARGKGQIFKVLEFLRALKPGGSTALAEAGRTLGAELKRRGVAIVVSDLYDPAGFERGINALRYQKFEPMVIHVTDARDADPGARGDVLLVDAESGDGREVTLTPALVGRFREAHGAWRREVEGFCKARRVAYAEADVEGALEDQVLNLFRRSGLVG